MTARGNNQIQSNRHWPRKRRERAPVPVKAGPVSLVRPAPREWVADLRRRMRDARVSDATMARRIGRTRWEFLTALSPTGHLCPQLQARIEAVAPRQAVRQ